MRSMVDLPEPDLAQQGNDLPLAQREIDVIKHRAGGTVSRAEVLATAFNSTMDWVILTSEMHAVFGHAVEPAPDKMVQAHHKHAHDADAQRDARKVTGCGHLGDVAAYPVRLDRRICPR